MKSRHSALAAALIFASWLAFFGDKTPAGGIADPVVRLPQTQVPKQLMDSGGTAQSTNPENIGRVKQIKEFTGLQARSTLIVKSTNRRTPNNLFSSQAWTDPISVPPIFSEPQVPPLPFTFLGKKSEDNQWEVYLSIGETTYIVREQNIVNETYRIDSINPPSLVLTYLPLKRVQTLDIGGRD